MAKIHMFECLNKTMDNNVESASGHLQFSNGKVIEVFIREHVFVNHAVRKKIFVKYVHLIYNLDYLWKSEINDVVKMVNFCSIKISQMLIA